jgi:hypothetical protein
MKRLRLNARVGGIDPSDKAAIAQAERLYQSKLQASQLQNQLEVMNAQRPEGAARIAGAFRATQPRGGNLMHDPNDLSDETMADLRRAQGHRGAMGEAPADPTPPPPAFHTQEAILDAIGRGFLTDAKKMPGKKWRNVVLGLMTNLKTLCPGGQNLSQILLTARRLDEGTKSAESEPDSDKVKDIRTWMLEEDEGE